MRSSVSGPYDVVGGIIMSFTFDYVNAQGYNCWGDSFTLKRTYQGHDGVIMSRWVGMIKLGLLQLGLFALYIFIITRFSSEQQLKIIINSKLK